MGSRYNNNNKNGYNGQMRALIQRGY